MNIATLKKITSLIGETDDQGCSAWLGTINQTGYGQIKFDGELHSAHRVVYEMLVGPIPRDLQIDHLCRNRDCVNPDHMEPVTIKVNVLRGQGVAAINAAKTKCPKGHPLSGPNLYIDRVGGRNCRQCHREKKYKNVLCPDCGKTRWTSSTKYVKRCKPCGYLLREKRLANKREKEMA